MVHLSWSPRAWVYKGFLTDEECEHIKAKVGGGRMQTGAGDGCATRCRAGRVAGATAARPPGTAGPAA